MFGYSHHHKQVKPPRFKRMHIEIDISLSWSTSSPTDRENESIFSVIKTV